MKFAVYILASKPYGSLYVGMTSHLPRRIWEHKNHVAHGHTQKYDITRLVWFEQHSIAENAIRREKALKRYKREWKIQLIEEDNPHWDDLFNDIAGS